ncbi:MAG: protein kinase, partial [Nannocystaceae bacterium]|nr:protein kinase [Nannocystaceae bacterium]
MRTRTGATIYDATDASGARVQLTAYDASSFPSALVLERSLRELRQLQGVEHPRIVKVLGCGKLEGGTWEAHAALPGPSLAETLAEQGPLSAAESVAVAQQIGEALAEAQKAGVIHRNLGADVIYPSPQGVLVAGFAVGAPQGGKAFGPLDTIAPEQVEGKVVDQRTLIYNLAALVQHMLRGRPLFTGDAASVLQSHLSAELPGDVSGTLRRGLAKDPRVRPMMLRQFVTELAGGVSDAPAAVPSSRGWTMFTTAEPATPAAATPAAATPAAATPAASAAASTAAPAPAADAPKPSTRG